MNNSAIITDYFKDDVFLDIPIYQRSYDWREKNCDKLFGDLMELIRSTNKLRMHFFGSLILMVDQETEHKSIIDGQQRITTIALLIAAIRDSLRDGEVVSSDEKMVKRLDNKLRDEFDGEIYLTPVKKDRKAYASIVKGDKQEFDETSNMTINYRFFRKSICRMDCSVDDLWSAMKKLYVMPIHLNSLTDDAQMVFESINSTGLNLTEGDKIRNYLLMNHSINDQNRYYEDYWSKIDDGSFNISSFFRDYITAITGDIPNKSEVYETFKVYANRLFDDKGTYNNLFESILRYKRIYARLVDSNLDNISKAASDIMYYLNQQGASTTYPFFMRVIDDNNAGKISNKEVEEVLRTVENYLLRRSICNLNASPLNKVFKNLYRTVVREGGQSFSEVLKFLILDKEGKACYPRDDQVINSLSHIDIYNYNVCGQVLAILEHANSDSADIFRRIVNQELTVEHIMPQKLSKEWQEELGEGWEEFHKEWVHRLGNLTLTAYNSKYSNNSFKDKKKMPDVGFNYSPLRLNMTIRESDSWGRDEIESRHKVLVDDFLRFVPEITTTYTPDADNDTIQEYTLEEDNEFFIDLSIRGYSYFGEEHKCKTGTEAFVALVGKICSTDTEIIRQHYSENTRGLNSYFRFGSEPSLDEEGYREACPGIWIYKSINQSLKVSVLKRLADLYGINYNDIVLIGIR